MLLTGNVHAKLIGHWPLRPKTPLRVEWNAENTDNTWKNGYDIADLATTVPQVVTIDDKTQVWEQVGPNNIFSSSLIPVDPSKEYRLSGKFRSTGKTLSKIYFGFVPMLNNEAKSEQASQVSFRKGNDGIFMELDKGTIVVKYDLTDWNSDKDPFTSRFMGFYYDGDTNKPADFIMASPTYGKDQGAFTSIEKNIINLSADPPEEVMNQLIPGRSVIKNHYTGAGSYLYSAAENETVTEKWTTYSAISTGDGWTQSASTNFRPFTRYVRLVLLLNYDQDKESVIQFDDLVLEEVNELGLTVYDESPIEDLAIDSHNHGRKIGRTSTINRDVYTAGVNNIPNGAMQFDGASDYISLPDDIGYSTEVSAFAWFKSKGEPKGGYHVIFGGQELEISIDSKQVLRTGIFTDKRYISNYSTKLLDGEWHHIGFTFNGKQKITYIDGKNIGTKSIYGHLTSSFKDRTIGRFGNSDDYYLNGALADIRIYDHALSLQEVNNIAYKEDTFASDTDIETINDKKLARHNLLYWDIINKKYWIGLFDKTAQTIKPSKDTFKDTAELSTLQSENKATNKLLYWDTDKKKYFIGQPDGTMRPLR